MKTVLIDDEFTLKPADVYNGEAYPKKDGIYAVDDGMTHYLVAITFDTTALTNMIYVILLPRKYVIEDYNEEQDIYMGKQLRAIQDAINSLEKTIDEQIDIDGVVEAFKTAVSDMKGGDVDLAGLTKLIAVAQKPDLLKGGR